MSIICTYMCVCAGVYMYALTWQLYFKMRGNRETWKFWLGFFLMKADAREFQRNFNFNCNVKGIGIWYLHFGKQVVSVPCCLDKFINSPWQRIENENKPKNNTKKQQRGEAPNQKQITRRLRYCLCSYQNRQKTLVKRSQKTKRVFSASLNQFAPADPKYLDKARGSGATRNKLNNLAIYTVFIYCYLLVYRLPNCLQTLVLWRPTSTHTQQTYVWVIVV